MHIRERFGLGLLVAALAIAPFGYWTNFGWLLLAMLLAVPAFFLLWTGRVARRLAEPSALDATIGADVPPGLHDVKGFHGADIFDHGGQSDASDGHH